MKVPVLEQSRVQQAELPGNGASPNLYKPMDVAGGIAGIGKTLGEGVGKAVGTALDEVQKAEQEASAFAEANALLEQQERFNRLWDGDSTKKTPGFSSLKGKAAMEQAADAVKQLDADRKELASKLADPKARQRFELRSREAMLAMRKQVEQHSGKEWRGAQSDLLKARMAQAIGMASAGVPDIDSWLSLSYQVEQDIVANAGSAEEGKLLAQGFRGQNGLAMLKGLVQQGRVEEAKQFLAENKVELSNGGTYDDAADVLKKATAGEERDRRVSEAAKLVDTTAESLRHESVQAGGGGYVDGEALRGAVKLEETDPEIRAEVEHALESRIRREEQRRLDDVKEAISQVRLADGERRPPGRHIEFLKQHPEGNEFLERREKALKAERLAMAERSRKKTGAELKASNAKRKEFEKSFVLFSNRALLENPDADLQDIYVDFLAEQVDAGREVFELGQVAKEQVAFDAAKYRKKATTEEGRKELAAERDVSKRLEKTIADAEKAKLKKGQKVDQGLLNLRVEAALMEYRRRLEAKGKPLDEKELTVLEAEAGRNTITETPRDIAGIPLPPKKTKGLGVDEWMKPPAAASPRPTITLKDGTKAQLSADGKTWEPIK